MEDRQKEKRSMVMLIASMAIWGSLGLFRRAIPLPSSVLAFVRGVAGSLFLILFVKARGGRVNAGMTRKQIAWFGTAGAIMAFNWILLFDAYNYTSVAVATLCYYMMPVFVTLASALLFGEKLTARKLLCVAVCVAGMLLVTGVAEGDAPTGSEIRGIVMGLAAAVLYSTVVLMNKKMPGMDAYEKTIVQLIGAAVIMVPYILVTEDVTALSLDGRGALMLFIVAAVHTGIAYALYFGCMDDLKAQTVAIFSYVDPIVAVLLSAFVLGEPLSALGVLGVVLVLGAAVVSEL
ncbi:MAG: EamA family transporter [Firmicutes bacterium]|nr:EamA family transporter [Bacillota bacterium]MBQ2084533.1 EamA family transporter [Bacillota bacterium]